MEKEENLEALVKHETTSRKKTEFINQNFHYFGHFFKMSQICSDKEKSFTSETDGAIL